MLNIGNQFVKPKKINYQDYLNVWVDDQKRIDIVKRLMITDKNFNLETLRTNPVYNNAYIEIIHETNYKLKVLDESWLWSRKFTPTRFKEFIIPFSIYSFIIIPYIFYKVLYKRIYEYHVKMGYSAENFEGFGYWNIDFENKDLYPESAIKLYFEVKKKNLIKETKIKKALDYSDEFVKEISRGYLSDFSKRRKQLGFDDDSI